MKKWFLLVLTILFVFAAAGCSSSGQTEAAIEQTKSVTESENQDTNDLTQNKANSESSDENKSNSNMLVVYFSRTGEQYGVGEIDKGNTAIVAEMIADKTGADMFEILPIDDHYPMTYDALTDVAKQEQNENARPEYLGEVPDLSQYDTVFIGAPVWWYTFPMIIYTLFDEYDFSGKTIVPFNTHMGSGDGGTYKTIEQLAPKEKVLSGLPVEMNDAENGAAEAIGKWLKVLAL